MRSIALPQPTKQHKTDQSSVFSCQYHVTGCPQYRRKVLVPPIDQRRKELIQEKQAAYGYEVLAMEIMPEHVHPMLAVDPRIGVNKVVGQMKGWTAHTIREEFPVMKSRLPSLWMGSKFISTIGSVSLEVVKQSIANQKSLICTFGAKHPLRKFFARYVFGLRVAKTR